MATGATFGLHGKKRNTTSRNLYGRCSPSTSPRNTVGKKCTERKSSESFR